MANYTPIVIIGAPRSGTNMLRDVLCKLKGVGTWPCDEINYIWKHGNISVTTDEFSPDLAKPKTIRYIQKQFDKLASKQKLDFVVEKTCANSLRVPFVNKVLPQAKYIFIYRNGIDALASANLRWSASLDLKYLYEKSRFVPITDLPYYAFKYLGNRLYRLFSSDKRLAFWGPQLHDMSSLLAQYSLEQVCALQWQRCVESADAALSGLPNERVVRVCYESFVENPESELKSICEQLGVPANGPNLKHAVSGVMKNSVGKGSKQLEQSVLEELFPLIGKTLDSYGYK